MSGSRSQPLPAKEDALFRQLVKSYESKQYKKAIKTADQILKKLPNHGETLAMKALNLSSMSSDKRQEAHDLAKAALKEDMQSHMCWHVYGILHRTDRNYEQAAKCYMNALKRDPENMHICKDLSNIQMQIRDIKGLIDTTSKMLGLRAHQRPTWMLLAIAHHLDKNYDTAADVLQSFLNTIDVSAAQTTLERVELGEVQLYRATVLHEGGRHEAAAEVLAQHGAHITDRLGKQELQASIHMALGDLEAAKGVYRGLVEVLPDNYDYHRGLCAAMELPDASQPAPPDVVEKLVAVYEELQGAVPSSGAAHRIPLDFLSGDAFAAAARERMRRFAQRGIWALFSDLKELLRDGAKEALLWREAAALLAEEGDGPAALWLRLYLAQHAAHMGRMEAAIEHVTAAEGSMNVADAAEEVFLTKADILAGVGDAEGAAAAAEVARQLDLKDRYVNSEAAKYLFRSGEVTRAQEVSQLFTRDSDQAGNDLFDMQVMWYEIESARAHFKAGNLAMALKMFRAVLSHFEEFKEDQFDFHSYCLRKLTLRAYVDLLHMEDSLHSNEAFRDAAVGAVRCYMCLHDDPPGSVEREAEERALASLPEAAQKKARDKKRREAEKKARAEAEQLEKDRAAHAAKKTASKFDEDPRGEKFLARVEPLAEASILVEQLSANAASDMRTHEAAYEVGYRQDKPHVALKAVKRAQQLDSSSSVAHTLLLRLMLWLEKRLPSIPIAVAREGMQAEVKKLTGGRTCQQVNDAFLAAAGAELAPLAAQCAHAQMQASITGDKVKAAKRLSECKLDKVSNTLLDCVSAHEWMLQDPAAANAAKTFYSQAQAVYQWSSIFDGRHRLPLSDDSLCQRIQQLHVQDKTE
eukprot:jgi/Ulvmu1/1371/UM011_0099.1